MNYIATFYPQETNSFIGKDIYPADFEGEPTWDCTVFLNSTYSVEEIEEIIEDGVGSELTDSVREDPTAPEWVREWDGPFEVRVTRIPA